MPTPDSGQPRPGAVPRAAGRRPPGPVGGRIANLRERFSDFPGFLTRLNREYGDVVSYQLPGKNFCVVFDADLIREMLVEKRSVFPKSTLYDVSDKFITKPAVFISEGDDHRRRRKLVEPAFGRKHLEAWAEIMVENAHAVQTRWYSFTGSARAEISLRSRGLGPTTEAGSTDALGSWRLRRPPLACLDGGRRGNPASVGERGRPSRLPALGPHRASCVRSGSRAREPARF